MKKQRFEYQENGAWFYMTEHGAVCLSFHGEHITTHDLLIRASVADDATKVTETNIADMPREER